MFFRIKQELLLCLWALSDALQLQINQAHKPCTDMFLSFWVWLRWDAKPAEYLILLPLWSTSSDVSVERGILPHSLGLNHASESFSLSDRGGASPHCAFTNPLPSPAKHSACELIWACSFCSSHLRSYHESGWGLWLWGLLLFTLEIPGIGNINKDVLFLQLWLQQLECLTQMTSLDAGI